MGGGDGTPLRGAADHRPGVRPGPAAGQGRALWTPPGGAETELAAYAERVAGPGTRARVAAGEDPASAIVAAAEAEEADVLVVGNIGMSGRKEFLLGNVPNRVSHNATCTVVIVNTADESRQKRRLPWSRT